MDEEKKNEINDVVVESKPKKKFFNLKNIGKKKIIVFSSIFLILIGVLVFVIIKNNIDPDKDKRSFTGTNKEALEKAITSINNYDLSPYTGFINDINVYEYNLSNEQRAYLASMFNNHKLSDVVEYFFEGTTVSEKYINKHMKKLILSKENGIYTFKNNENERLIHKILEVDTVYGTYKIEEVVALELKEEVDGKTVYKYYEVPSKGERGELDESKLITTLENPDDFDITKYTGRLNRFEWSFEPINEVSYSFGSLWMFSPFGSDHVSKFNSEMSEDELREIANNNGAELNIKYTDHCSNVGKTVYNSGYLEAYRNGEKLAFFDAIEKGDKIYATICKDIYLDGSETKIDVNKIDTSKNLKGTKLKLDALSALKESSSFTNIKGSEVKYSFTDGTFKIKVVFSDDDENSKPEEHIYEYKNVNKAYAISEHDCQTYTNFILLTDSNIYYIEAEDYKFIDDEYADVNPVKTIIPKKMYKQIYNVFLRGLTCGAEYVLLGETEDGVIYDILTNEVVDTGVEYYFYNYITNDRKLLNYKEDLIVKAVISDAPNSGIQYFVDSNNYLYGFNYDEGVTITKVSDKKVKYIYYGEKDERAYIQFTDDSFFSEHGNSKRISYVKVDK